jgi:hypothetical protein
VQPRFLAAPGLHFDASLAQTREHIRSNLCDFAICVAASRDDVRQVERLLQRQVPQQQADERLRVVGQDGRTAG